MAAHASGYGSYRPLWQISCTIHSTEITIDGIYYSFHEDSWYAEHDANVASMVAIQKELLQTSLRRFSTETLYPAK